LLSEYRDEGPYLNMTLRVISCSPRPFEIVNFLSKAEVYHIMYLMTGMKLHWSTTARGSEIDSSRDNMNDTRTSLNTWVYREKDAVIDTIYRRAADLLRIHEALLRPRSEDEYPHMDSRRSLAEALQLVHYDVGQEYTAHHDFGYSCNLQREQPARFTTLLLYLNEVMEGGATQFLRWVNAETSEGLNVESKVGKAMLFYSQLPDGNMDDWSHHAALPVRKGEMWLMNLW
jgi:prolyl 4-hydroxylase